MVKPANDVEDYVPVSVTRRSFGMGVLVGIWVAIAIDVAAKSLAHLAFMLWGVAGVLN